MHRTAAHLEDSYFQLIRALHKEIKATSISLEKCTLSEEKLAEFRAYSEGISVADLEEEITNFKDGNEVRHRLLRFIRQRTEENKAFPLGGHITRIGSSWDGTKVGHLDEVDTLYVLHKDQVAIIPGEHGDIDIESFRVEWKGRKYTASELSELFANELDQALRTEPPEGMEHNGYAAPRYSGVRVCGPAVTVLFRTATDLGLMERGSMVSLDITLALPFSYLQSDEQNTIDATNMWFTNYIISTNDKPIDAVEPHVIPCRVKNVWKPTTAYIEANALHELERNCALKKAHILLKCLMKKVDKFNCEHRIFQNEADEDGMDRSTMTKVIEMGEGLDDADQVNLCMRYGHIFLSLKERKRYNELEKKNISINAAAAKQILFQRATREDCMPGWVDESRTLSLLKEVVTEIAKPGILFTDNYIHHSFPPICKFSFRETLLDKFNNLASNLLRQFSILSSSISTEVCIRYILTKKALYLLWKPDAPFE